jgi:hypothetical protein
MKGYYITLDYGVACGYLLAVTFPKLAILDLYLHIFVKKAYRYATYAIGTVLIANAVINLPVILAQCQPVAAQWDDSAGTCINMVVYWALGSLINIITDFVMFVPPIPMILTLQATRRVKASISMMFVLGSLYVLHHLHIETNLLTSAAAS